MFRSRIDGDIAQLVYAQASEVLCGMVLGVANAKEQESGKDNDCGAKREPDGADWKHSSSRLGSLQAAKPARHLSLYE
jgi:hypothetical protein